MRQFSFYLPHKNIVPQRFFTEIFLPEGTPNKFKNKGNSKGCVCVCRGGGGDDKHPLEWKKQKQKCSPWMRV